MVIFHSTECFSELDYYYNFFIFFINFCINEYLSVLTSKRLFPYFYWYSPEYIYIKKRKKKKGSVIWRRERESVKEKEYKQTKTNPKWQQQEGLMADIEGNWYWLTKIFCKKDIMLHVLQHFQCEISSEWHSKYVQFYLKEMNVN